MTGTSRLRISIASCCALAATACGAGDTRLDPGDLALRDLLGISPDVAVSWDPDQRAAARHVIQAGLHQAPAVQARASLGKEPVLDRRVATALATVDGERARRRADALGVVQLAVGTTGLVATPRAATLEPHATPPLDLELRGWNIAPGWNELPARGMSVLAALASDAGHRGGAVVVAPVSRLAVAAAYLPATASEPARLVVNPTVLAALEPRDPAPPPGPPAAATTMVAAASGPPRAAATAAVLAPVPLIGAASGQAPAPPTAAAAPAAHAEGNPYSFYGSVAECAAAQRERCDACLADGSCTAVTDLGDGNAECTQLAANSGRGQYLLCINLALAIDAVASCAAGSAPSCPRDTHASESIASLDRNARFLDDAACAAPLDGCLATLYGPPRGGFPGPGSGGDSSPPRRTSIDCSDSCSSDTNCELDPSCELDGPTCDPSYDGDACADSNEQSGCGDTGGGAGADSCSGDSEDSCGSSDNTDCDSSDCGGGGDSDCSSGGDGGDCSGGGEGGDCGGGGGGDCGGGGGGDCGGGGGGDCGGGGGGDCSAAAKRGRSGARLPVAIAWAILPIPFAALARRRARRRVAVATVAAAAGQEVAS